jgi:hypothetical protein
MPDGSEYIGEFFEGVQHGDGMIKTVDGVQITGVWENGKYKQLEYSFNLDTSDDKDNLAETWK